MAAASSSSSSSSSSSAENHEGEKYEVFISFRGADVRHRFLSHLFAALDRKRIHAFIDDNLERGKDISGSLFRIIEESDLSIVIFSQNYPESEWCLEELEKIYESMKQRKQIVIPVFYDADPSDVQELKGNYAIEVQKWRDALMEISNLSGFDSKDYLNEAKLIDAIVNVVSTKLRDICPSNSHIIGKFGIDSSIKDVELLLCINSVNDVRMVGIWGMGGIGKTTLASITFDRNRKHFHRHCFVANVRETLSKNDGLQNLRDKIVHDLLGDKDVRVDSPHLIDDSIQRRLKRTKVLIVLDDVHTCMQLKFLLEDIGLYANTFCPGSRIIVTSRNWQVLENVNMKSYIYEAKQLKYDEALQLFSWHAFGQKNPQEEYKKLSEKVVQYSRGVPLVLVVLGSELKRKTTGYWEDSLRKLNDTSPFEIQKILRISFDGLDWYEKNIFLDIACFWNTWKRSYVEDRLDAFGFYASTGINRLIDKSLLTEKDGLITMHDLLKQMGQEIVAEEKQSQQQQSRLWTSKDIIAALTNNRGTENVEVIWMTEQLSVRRLDINPKFFSLMCKLRRLELTRTTERRSVPRFDINPKAFSLMCKLRSLTINFEVRCCVGLEFLPDSIRYLYWERYPWSYLPPNYNPEKLAELRLTCSKIQEIIWNKPLKDLKRIYLSCSYSLIRVSELAMAPNLEVAFLNDCTSLVEIGASLENLSKLTHLNVDGCRRLSYLPEIPRSIKVLVLKGSGLSQLPSTIGFLTHLKELSLTSCIKLESLPSSIGNLTSLEAMDLGFCFSLVEIGSSLENLKKLAKLNLSGCRRLSYLPKMPCSTEGLDVYDSGLGILPSTICNLISLKWISLSGCNGLESLPSSICNLNSLEILDISRCKNLQKLPENFGNLESLEKLYAYRSGLRELPLSIQNLKNLFMLQLTGSEDLESLLYFPSNLKVLYAGKCKSLKKVPTPFIFPQISLDLSECPMLKKIASSIMDQYLSKAISGSILIPNFCIGGSEVPEWMKYRNNNGTSLSIKLDTVGHTTDFIFCIVIPSGGFMQHQRAILMHESGLKEYYFDRDSDRLPTSTTEEAFHVLLWSSVIEYTHVEAVSFESTLYSTEERIKCGVHPIFKDNTYRNRKHQEDEAEAKVDY